MDCEGFMWYFGENSRGQLGTGNKTDFNVPQKIEDIPPVLSVSCGAYHTLIITNDSNLWSCGNNENGQLCIENKEIQMNNKVLFKLLTEDVVEILLISGQYQHHL